MSWSPDGKRLAFSANQDLGDLPPTIHETQTTMQSDSDLAVIDLDSWDIRLVSGASVRGVVETFPRWTPDGKRLVYCEAPPSLPEPKAPISLRIIPVEGGVPQPLPNVPQDGASRVYPRFSPDGRWFTFVRTVGGALTKPSSDLYIMPADFSAPPRALESNAPHASDSWYSWSSSSRWILFTSKRDDGIHARLYLTHIDAAGHASPPVRLPTPDEPLMSFNVPEFVSHAPTISERDLFNAINVDQPAERVPDAGARHD
jgi:Tol biopolymer transport system component